MLGRSLTLVSFALLASCSSDATETPPPADPGVVGDIREAVTWEDGTRLGGVIRIVEGAEVTIAPGATITCNAATHILIGGSLKVDSKDNHAKITCKDSWTGITVAQKGKLSINGLDIENAGTGIETTSGAGECTVSNSKITTTVRPFKVGKESKLTLDHVEMSVPATVGQFDSSIAEVFGTLDAKFISYESQTNEGIMTKDGGDTTITDSKLTAHGGQDLVSSYGGNSVNVSYTTMSGAHCGVHLQGVKTATFDHITSLDNLYGVTIYGAETAMVTNSNLGGTLAWLDLQGDHGAVHLDNNFKVGSSGAAPKAIVGTPIPTDMPVSDTDAAQSIPDAAPRGDLK